MKVPIEIQLRVENNQIRYVFDTLFSIIGFPFTVNTGCESLLKVVYARYPEGRCDLFIPAYPYHPWAKNKPKITFLNNIPVLYISDKPYFLIHEGKIGFDLINSTFYLLSRYEEYLSRDVDQHGRFPHTSSVLYSAGILKIPVINFYISILKNFLQAKLYERGINLKPITLWKNQSKLAVALTHDVDLDYMILDHVNFVQKLLVTKRTLMAYGNSLYKRLRTIYLGGISLFQKMEIPDGSRYSEFEQWMKLEEGFGYRSTFYFSANVKNHYYDNMYSLCDKWRFNNKKLKLSEIMKIMAREGWEIGLHGSYMSYCNEDILKREKLILEEVLGKSITGIRQHRLRFDITKTLRIQEKCGFKYDTSLGYNKEIGYRAGIAYPFYPFGIMENRVYNLLEMPLVIQEIALFRGKSTDIDQCLQKCISLIDEVEQIGGLIILLWHSHLINTKSYSHWITVYRELLRYLYRKRAFVSTLGEISNYWQDRLAKVKLGMFGM